MGCEFFVKSLTGEIIPVDVDSEELENMTVGEFRRRVDGADKMEDYRLFLKGRKLEDHKTLRDYGILRKHSTLLMVKRLRGGERCTIYVESLTGNRTSVDVDSEEELENMSVGEFRRRLDRLDPCDDYILFFKGEILKDYQTLGDSGIIYESTLYRTERRPAGGSCTIYVESLTGKIIPVDVDSEELKNMTVEEFRRRVDRTGQSDDYRLFFKSRELEDHQTLRDCGITHLYEYRTLLMTERRPGGERHTINVKSLTGKTIPVDVDSEELENMTVEEFRRRLDRELRNDDYILLFEREILKDHQTLRDYGIKDESTLIMYFLMRGGGHTGPLSKQRRPSTEDEDEEEEDKGIPRTESMEVLAPPMQQPESNGWCCIL
ncbi:unnamed protein product [Leuciscus chuanchicus]